MLYQSRGHRHRRTYYVYIYYYYYLVTLTDLLLTRSSEDTRQRAFNADKISMMNSGTEFVNRTVGHIGVL